MQTTIDSTGADEKKAVFIVLINNSCDSQTLVRIKKVN